MYGPTGEDEFDWTGCEVVQWDPEMLSGRANVAGTRMFADSVLENYDDGMTAEEISYTYSTDLPHVVALIRFVEFRRLKAIA